MLFCIKTLRLAKKFYNPCVIPEKVVDSVR